MEVKSIAVFGATGVQGRPVVDAALDAGMEVRALSRDPEQAREKLPGGLEVRVADLTDPEDVEEAFDGVDGAFFHFPLLPEDVPPAVVLDHVLGAARRAQLKRLVFTTSAWCGESMPSGKFVDGLRQAAEAVLACGVPAVVLRPTLYLANLVWPHLIQEMRATGRLRYPPLDPGRRMNWTATEDQGRIAVACMNADVVGEVLDVASPEPVTGPELARLLAGVHGREVHFDPETVEDFADSLGKLAGSPGIGEAIGSVYGGINRLPEDGLLIDTDRLATRLEVELTPVSRWVRDYYGQLLELYG